MAYLAGNPEKFATTADYFDEPRFVARACPIPLPPPDNEGFVEAMRLLGRILAAARGKKALLLYGSNSRWYPDMLAAAIVGLWPKRYRPVIVLTGDTWEPKPGLRHLVNRLVVKLADRAISRYTVVSTDELHIFPHAWGVAEAKMRFCPWGVTARDHDDETDTFATPPGDYIFVGGNTYRDYEPLLAAARQLPGYHFLMATACLSGRADLPPNITVRSVRYSEFMVLMRSAAVVIAPIRLGLRRTAGLLTLLNAMWLGKPTIVTDALGARDYIQDGETGLIVDGTPESYVEALRWMLDPGNRDQVTSLCARAHRVVSEQFTFENHVISLLAVLDEAISEAARGPVSPDIQVKAA